MHNFYFEPFTLSKYFEKYDSTIPKTITRKEIIIEKQTYTPTHDDIARECKKAAKHKCQKCGVDCSEKKYLLQLHHIGIKSDNRHDKRRVLCTDCHSKEPMHSQMKTHPDFPRHIKEINSLREEQGITVLKML